MYPHKTKFFIFLILLLAVILRVCGIQWGLPSKNYTFSYHPDEYTPLKSLSRMDPKKLDFNPRYLINPTFDAYMIGAVFKACSLFNIIEFADSKDYYMTHIDQWSKLFLIGRLTTLIFSILSVSLIFLLASKWQDRRVGILSSLWLAILPAYVAHSHYFTPNSPIVLWTILSFLGFLFIIRGGDSRWYILSGVAIGWGMATKYSMASLLVVLVLAHTLRNLDKRNIKKTLLSFLDRKLLFGIISAVLTFIILSPYTVLDWKEFAYSMKFIYNLTHSRIHIAPGEYNLFYDWITPLTITFKKMMGVPLLILFLVSLSYSLFKKERFNWLLISFVLIVYINSVPAGTAIATSGRILFCIPACILLISRFLVDAFSFNTKYKAFKDLILVILVLAVFAHTLIYAIAIDKYFLSKPAQDEANDWIISLKDKPVKIGVFRKPFWHFPGLINEFYYHPEYYPHKQNLNLVVFDYDKSKIEQEDCDYIITTDFEQEYRKRMTFDDFANEYLRPYGYTLYKTFKNEVKILGFDFSEDKLWYLVYNPQIYIFKNKSLGNE